MMKPLPTAPMRQSRRIGGDGMWLSSRLSILSSERQAAVEPLRFSSRSPFDVIALQPVQAIVSHSLQHPQEAAHPSEPFGTGPANEGAVL
jgi:hypothetical protein